MTLYNDSSLPTHPAQFSAASFKMQEGVIRQKFSCMVFDKSLIIFTC